MRNKEIIDFHAHILPRADHGSDSLRTSEHQIQLYRKYGITSVVATPHFYPQKNTVDEFLERRESSCEKLKEILRDEDVCVYQGAEVLICPGIDRMDGLQRLCIKGTDVILLELPFTAWSDAHIEAVRNISNSGLTVVMAHINRYSDRNIEKLARECDVLYQINSEIAKGLFYKNKTDKLVRSLSIVALGSDLHGAAESSPLVKLLKLNKYLEKKKNDVMSETSLLLEGAEPI